MTHDIRYLACLCQNALRHEKGSITYQFALKTDVFRTFLSSRQAACMKLKYIYLDVKVSAHKHAV